MKYFVTGNLGFIGSNFVRYVLSNDPNNTVIGYDKITYCGNPENLRDLEDDKRYLFLKGDICDYNYLNQVIKVNQPDVVVHFAAESHVDRSIESGRPFIMTNVYGSFCVFQTCQENKIRRVIHISTDEVYGSVTNGFSKETDNMVPSSIYSSSKSAADFLAMSFYRTYGTPIIITRSSNNFGPYQYPEKLIPLFITNILENKKVPLYGDGLNIRDWIYVLDNCAGIQTVIEKGIPGQAYNIGGGTPLTNELITDTIIKELGKDKSVIEYVKDRPGHDRRYALNSSKVEKLGWKPEYKFEEAIKSTINWYKNNVDWWRPLKK